MRAVRNTPSSRAAVCAAGLAASLWAAGCVRKTRAEVASPAPAPRAAAEVSRPAAEPSTSPPDSARATHDNLLVTEDEYQGWRYYHVYCARCHGQDALGSVNAANLRQSISEDGGVTRDSFVVVARNGSAENKEMKGFHELLSDEQIGQIYAYVKARSDGRLATGRPHRKAVSP